MTTGTGLDNKMIVGTEGSYGSGAATRAIEYETESLNIEPGTAETRGAARMFLPSSRFRRFPKSAGGDVNLDFFNQGMGIFLKQMLGAVSGPTRVGETAEYVQTHTPDTANGGRGISMVIQVGKARVGGTVTPFTWHGCKVVSWELSNDVDNNLKLKLTFDAKPEKDTSTALVSASYDADIVPLSFLDASVTINGVSADIQQISFTGQKTLAVDRRFLGNTKKEPLMIGEFVIGGTLGKEFEDTDLYDDFVAGEIGEIVATWAFGEVEEAGEPFKLVVTCPAVRWDGGNPEGNGSEIVTQNIPFKCLDNGSDPVIALAYHSTDTTI